LKLVGELAHDHLHGLYGVLFWATSWNPRWKEFIIENLHAGQAQILGFLAAMRKHVGI